MPLTALRGPVIQHRLQWRKISPEDELNLRLASIASQEQKYNQAYEYLKNIKTPEKLPEKAQIERVNLAVRLLKNVATLIRLFVIWVNCSELGKVSQN